MGKTLTVAKNVFSSHKLFINCYQYNTLAIEGDFKKNNRKDSGRNRSF